MRTFGGSNIEGQFRRWEHLFSIRPRAIPRFLTHFTTKFFVLRPLFFSPTLLLSFPTIHQSNSWMLCTIFLLLLKYFPLIYFCFNLFRCSSLRCCTILFCAKLCTIFRSTLFINLLAQHTYTAAAAHVHKIKSSFSLPQPATTTTTIHSLTRPFTAEPTTKSLLRSCYAILSWGTHTHMDVDVGRHRLSRFHSDCTIRQAIINEFFSLQSLWWALLPPPTVVVEPGLPLYTSSHSSVCFPFFSSPSAGS